MVSICALIAATLTSLSETERQPYIDVFVAKQKTTETYQARMRQTLRLRGLKHPVVSEARVFYKAPASLLMAYTKPAGDYLIVTGEDVYVKKANRPLTHRKNPTQRAHPAENAQMLLSLFQGGAKDWSELFNFEMARDDDRLIVTMHPKETDARSRDVLIENVIALPPYEIRSITISFGEQNSMTYEFSDAIRNESLDDKLFVPPASDRKM
jgi:outer membrane lipoprotein-sorting protein